MFDYLIVVNDNGEMKTITSADIIQHSRPLDAALADYLNKILDYRSAAEAVTEIGVMMASAPPAKT